MRGEAEDVGLMGGGREERRRLADTFRFLLQLFPFVVYPLKSNELINILFCFTEGMPGSSSRSQG